MSKLEQLHYSLGHLNYHAIKGMVYNPKGKATSASFPASKSSHADKVIGLIHSDLWGSALVQTIIGTCYVITFMDNKSCWTWVAFLKHKSDAFAAFKEWLTYVENKLASNYSSSTSTIKINLLLKNRRNF